MAKGVLLRQGDQTECGGRIAYGTDNALSELSGATGEFIGEKLGLYEVTSND